MSNHLAIAHVTSALGKIAWTAANNGILGNAGLTYGRPDTNDPKPRVNVYLYQVIPNAARRNDDVPTRGADGKLTARPRAALDLHYLFTFHGKTDSFDAERMAGAVARELHTNPVLDSKRLGIGLSGVDVLKDSDLGLAFDRVRITPIVLSLEELSRLWSVLVQTPHVLSVAYEASVVLIDAVTDAAATLPVLRRGDDGRGAIVGTDRVPRLTSAWIEFSDTPARTTSAASLPAAALGTSIKVQGENLEADKVELTFKNPVRPSFNIPIPAEDRSSTELRFRIPDDAAAEAAWASGLYTVTATLERNGKQVTSPIWPFLFAPRLSQLTAVPPGPAGASIDVTASLRPGVRTVQRAILRAGPREVHALPRLADSDPVVFRLTRAPALSDVPVTVEVDGVETMPIIVDPVSREFAFDPSQRLTIA